MQSLSITTLLEAYRAQRFSPVELMQALLERCDAAPERNVWIERLPREQVLDHARQCMTRSSELPLYGVPFAVKDNIDLAGVPTTAACPEFKYVPQESAHVVQRLLAAGAIPIGKTNLDQFATGLVGTRSPFGACRNSFDADYVSGGSSSGSAVAVATGLVSFALGTDTAGSGRVPAAFNNIVGLKPSCGSLSTRGVVPACRSLDCVSILALTAADARAVLQVAQGFDAVDPYSRAVTAAAWHGSFTGLRIAVPRAAQLEFFGNADYARLFAATCRTVEELGAQLVEVDCSCLFEAARLLYEGPWVAERYAAVGEFIAAHPQAALPVTAQIILAGNRASALDCFRAQYRLQSLQRAAQVIWQDATALLLPTAGTHYTLAAVQAQPIELNSHLGRYTNFVNLLDLAALAVPAGLTSAGLPFGVTLMAPRGTDATLLDLGAQLHAARVETLGATGYPLPPLPPVTAPSNYVNVAVCGAHLSGLALNHQLLERGAFLVRATQTAPAYRFFALPGGPPERPGLVRVRAGGGAIAVEVWALPQEAFGSFVAGIPAPLGIGKVELADGSWCSGFLCEGWAVEQARDITALGNWRDYLARASS
jgi:allophanate hydrolase